MHPLENASPGNGYSNQNPPGFPNAPKTKAATSPDKDSTRPQSSKSSFQGLLLDLDGTLIDSEHTHLSAYRRMFQAKGWQVADAEMDIFKGRPGPEVFQNEPGPWRGLDPEKLGLEARSYVDIRRDPPRIFAGAREIMQLNIPKCLVTSAWRTWAALASQMLHSPADLKIVTQEDISYGKPHPEPYLLGAAALNLSASSCIVIEDTVSGICSARQAGVGKIYAVATSQSPNVLLEAGANRVTHSLEELLPYFPKSWR